MRTGWWAVLFWTAIAANGQSFNQGGSYPAQNGSLSIATADFNGDGKLDMAVANSNSSSISIFLGNGDGTFTAAPTVAAPSCYVTNVTAGQFTGDGKTDLLAACGFETTVFVFPGLGNGQFGAGISTQTPEYILTGLADGIFNGVAVADFNGDGKLDLVIQLVSDLTNLDNPTLVLMLGNGNGTFQAPSTLFAGLYLGNVIAADMNGDGKPDLVLAGTQVTTDSDSPQIGSSSLLVYLGDGKGGFRQAGIYTLPGVAVAGYAAVADVNRDGIPDVISVNALVPANNSAAVNSELEVFIGTGTGTLEEGFTSVESSLVMALVAADFRGTGTADLVELDASNLTGGGTFGLSSRMGNGDGTFQKPVPIPLNGSLTPVWFGLTAADFSGDGLPDVAFISMPSIQFALSSGNNLLQELGQSTVVILSNTDTPPPLIAVSNPQLQFSYVVGGSAPASQSIAISNGRSGALNWTATTSAQWLTVSPASGTAPGTIQVSVASGMAAGTYQGTVQISSTGASNTPLSVPVTLVVSAASTEPVITAVQNGASFQPGIESGSWVTIKGANLANSLGQIWTASDIVDGNLPTSLAGTSVTIDGKPAYTYYVGQSQINVQAPTDAATGTVNVVVTNNGVASQPFPATLQTAAPALFEYPLTTYAIATRYPDNAWIGNPSAITGTTPAKAGDILILWATGFGPTSPPTPAGVAVTGAPPVATLPTITVGGTAVSVISAVLSPGSAGLYQIAIQLPANVPTGTVAIQASVGSVQSPSGVDLFVGN